MSCPVVLIYLCASYFYACVLFVDNSPYLAYRVNITESISLSILALLSSILATLEPPLSTDAAIAMAFLTIFPAIGFAIMVIISYSSHINRVLTCLKCCRHWNTNSTAATSMSINKHGNDDNDDLDTSIPPFTIPVTHSHAHATRAINNNNEMTPYTNWMNRPLLT